MTSPPRPRGLVFLALFLSGLAGLMHEVVWAKLLANLTGSTAKSHAVVLSVFMGGLAIGAVIFGRRSDKRERPLMVYVWLEVLIGLYCLVLPILTKGAGSVYESLAAATFEQQNLKLVLRLVLALAVVALPAIMMGGTLPVLARYLVEEVAQTRKAVASLYALNNIGAVLGSGVAGFYLLPELGIWSALAVASTMNFVAAAMVWLADRRARYVPRAPEPEIAPLGSPSYTAGQFRIALWALALSGFAAMGHEVVFLRIIALGFGSSNYSFTVMLMCFITGIGIGSGIISLIEVKRPMWWLAASQAAVVVSLVAITPLMERLPYAISSMRTQFLTWPTDPQAFAAAIEPSGGNYFGFLQGQASYCFLMLLLPTVCIGFGFPLVSQIQARSASSIGSVVGNTYAWNTVGNVLGVVITSLVLMPLQGALGGIEGAFHVNLALNGVAILLLVVAAGEAHLVARTGLLAAAAGAVVLYASSGLAWSRVLLQSEGHLRLRKPPPPDADALMLARHPATSYEAWKKKHLRDDDPRADGWDEFFLRQDADTNVVGVRRERLAAIFINSKGDASTGPLDMITFLLSGHIPMFFLREPKNVMVVGHGSGVTTGAISLFPTVERIDVVEISKAVFEADKLFENYNHKVLSNPKTHQYLDDARTFLRTVPRKYDLIVSQPSNPWIAGIGSLFTVDFFEDCRDRLTEGGIMMVWFHHYEQSDETIQLITRTINSVFPHVECFLTVESDVIGLASMQPLELDFAAMERLLELHEVRSDLARVGVYNLASMLAYHGVDSKHFAALVGEGPLNTDDHQQLEYKGARNMFLGINAELYARDPGFDTLPDGTTTSLLDRYIAWRAAQGEPVHQSELGVAHATVTNILTTEHRLSKALRERAERATDTGTPSSVARGLRLPPSEMKFSEAFNWGQYISKVEGPNAALPFIQRAVECEPTNSGAALALAGTLQSVGRADEAVATLQRVIQNKSPRSDPHFALAHIAIQSQRLDDARKILNGLIDYEENVAALMLMGEIVGGFDNDMSAAKQFFKRAIVRDARLTKWEASMNYSQICKMEAQAWVSPITPDQIESALRALLPSGVRPTSKQVNLGQSVALSTRSETGELATPAALVTALASVLPQDVQPSAEQLAAAQGALTSRNERPSPRQIELALAALREGLSEIKYARYHNEEIADLQQQEAELLASIGQLEAFARQDAPSPFAPPPASIDPATQVGPSAPVQSPSDSPTERPPANGAGTGQD
jgi:predicted membrane-bound spermidine synthase/tetratricopeptide (TPR) repeat protein